MTIMAMFAHSARSKHCGEPRAMMQYAMQPGLRTTGFRLLCSLNEFQRKFNLRRRRGFGSLLYCDARRSNRFPLTICPWHGYHDPVRATIPSGHTRNQRLGIVLDRSAYDASYRATATASQLAVATGGRLLRRLHNILQLRMGNAQLGEGWRPVAGRVQYCRKCAFWICGRVAGIDHRRKALINNMR